MDEAELLYGQQLKLTFIISDILEILEEAKVYYNEAVIDRIEEVLRYQYRKYGYLISK